MLRALGRGLGWGMMAAGLGWLAYLLGPEMIEKRRLPDMKQLPQDRRLAPGSVLLAAGFVLKSSCRARPKPPPEGAPDAG